jgi:hypothetical protein
VKGEARRWAVACCLGLAACVTPSGVPGPDASGGPRLALERFAAAAEGGRFAEAQALLSARWRERLTPARLAADFALEPLALRRLSLAAASRLRLVEPGRAEAALGEGRTLVLVEEPGGWRLDRLE